MASVVAASGEAAFVAVARGSAKLFLSEHIGDARPDTLVTCACPTSTPWLRCLGVDAEDAPWAREIELRDPDRNRLRIGTPREKMPSLAVSPWTTSGSAPSPRSASAGPHEKQQLCRLP